MTRFLLNIDESVSEFHGALILDAMQTEFPAIEFVPYAIEGASFLANTVIPLLGGSVPGKPDHIRVEMPPEGLVGEVQGALRRLMPEVMARKVS